MRILHIIDDLSPGGAERLLESSLPLIKKKGNQVFLMLLENNQCHYKEKIINNQIPIIVAPANKMRSIKNIFYIRKFIKKEKIDIVHAHLFPVLYWVALAKCLSRDFPITVFTEHGVSNRRRNKKYLRVIENFIYTRFDFITCISPSVEHSLTKWINKLSNSSTKVKVIGNGIDLSDFSLKTQLKSPDIGFNYSEVKVITMVGRLVDSKDHLTLINAMKKLTEEIHLVLIGVGQNHQMLKEYVKQESLQDRVHFLGYRKDIKEILNISSIVVLSSHKEGFGLAALEGMAMKKPVIGTNIDGLLDVIQHKDLLFDVGDDDKLAKTIQMLLADEKIYAEFAEYCYKRSKKYDISIMIDKWNDIYINGAKL